MNAGTVSLAIIGGFGLGMSSLLGLYLLTRKKELSEVLLAALLIFLSLRIAKSVFYNFIDLPLFVKNLGLAFNLAVGPTLLFYGKALFDKNFKIRPGYIAHFVPSVIYIVFSSHIPNNTPGITWQISYGLILIQFFTYLGICTYLVWQNKPSPDTRWFFSLTITLAIINCVYLFIHIGLIPYYSAGIVSFTFLMVFVAIGIASRIEIPHRRGPKYSGYEIKPDEAARILGILKERLTNERLYLNPNLTLQELAVAIDLSPRAISQTINSLEGTNFATFINKFRLDEAKRLLRLTEQKIAAVAFNSGFKSISAFNEAFKNQFDATPSQYRKES